MLHWIHFKNELPARDAARVRKAVNRLQGGGSSTPKPPTTHFALPRSSTPSTQETLRAGAHQATRYFYKTSVTGQRLTSKVYTLQHGGPLHVAREVAKAALHGASSHARQHVPASVRSAVRAAVHNGYVTEAHGRKYCDKYKRDAGKGKVLIHIREKGKHKVRQYEAACVMQKHPSTHNIRDMKTKHVLVHYVQTFACGTKIV